MQAQQRLQAAHKSIGVQAAPKQKELTALEAIATVRCIPARFTTIVEAILEGGVPDSIASLALALDGHSSATPFVTLVGKTGAGKTTTALTIPAARAMLASKPVTGQPRATNSYPSWRFIHADDVCNCRRFSKLGITPRVLDDACSKSPLIIDDIIGQRDIDGDLYAVLRHREENAYPTVFTTGLSREEVSATYGAMFARRLFSGLVHLIGTRK